MTPNCPKNAQKKPINVFTNYYSTFNENIVKNEQIGENTIKTAFFLGEICSISYGNMHFFSTILFKLPLNHQKLN